MFCRNCGNELLEGAEFCTSCGANPLKGNKFCNACGVEVRPEAEVCVKCGVRLAKAEVSGVSGKSRLAVTLPSVLPGYFGIAGVHRFYLGKIGTGIAMLLTLGGLGIWTLIDFIFAVSGKMKDKEGLIIEKW